MKLLIELQALLESYDPRRLLLQVQQLLTDEYSHANVELSSTDEDTYSLELTYFDLKPITLNLYKAQADTPWMIEYRTQVGSLYPTPFDAHVMTAHNIFNALDLLLQSNFEQCVSFEDGCDQALTGEIEKWVYEEVNKLFKYLEEGRLKKAADIHVVLSTVLDDEGLQKLETRYNSILVNHKKLNRVPISHRPHPADATALAPMEVYILAALE